MTKLSAIIPGLTFTVFLALISYATASLPIMANTGISSLVLAIIFGIIIGNVWTTPSSFAPGIQFSAKRILRIAIVLYGFRVTVQEIASVGVNAIFIDIAIVVSTLIFGYYLGKKLFKLDNHLALLISAGAAICGAAAVLAVEDVIKSEPYKTSVAIGTVVLFGTLSMFIYPLLQHANFFGFTDTQFGIYCGASIHEVAQALVAGTDINIATGKMAVIVKMMRVLMLVPVLLCLSFLNNRHQQSTQKSKILIPWFAIGFGIVILFNSLHLLSATLVTDINQIDIVLLTMAMGAIGVETKYQKIKKVGLTPLLLALLLAMWLFSVGFLLVKLS